METKEKKLLFLGIVLALIFAICLCLFCTDSENTDIKGSNGDTLVDSSRNNHEEAKSVENDTNSSFDASVNSEDSIHSETNKTDNSTTKGKQDKGVSDQKQYEFETEEVDI